MTDIDNIKDIWRGVVGKVSVTDVFLFFCKMWYERNVKLTVSLAWFDLKNH